MMYVKAFVSCKAQSNANYYLQLSLLSHSREILLTPTLQPKPPRPVAGRAGRDSEATLAPTWAEAPGTRWSPLLWGGALLLPSPT